MLSARQIGLFFGSLGCILLLAAPSAAALFKVNSTNWGMNCDQQLSLEEATFLATGGLPFPRPLTNGEKASIEGGATFVLSPGPPLCDIGASGWILVDNAGLNFADDIVFTDDAIGVLSGSASLGKNDDINGMKPNGTRVILDGISAAQVCGVFLNGQGSGSQVRNLEIRNFSSCGVTGDNLAGAIFEGLDIHNNNGNGLSIGPGDSTNSRNVRIGGPSISQRNFIYANALDGIRIVALANTDRGGAQNIVIENNYIGTRDGTTDQGNSSDGIYLEHAFGVTIGDTTGATRNVISGNNNDGIKVSHTKSVSNVIVGNFIGTNAAGNAVLGNSLSGVSFINGAGWNDGVGGSPNELGRPGLGNVLSGNGSGVYLGNSLTTRTLTKGNKIGTNLSGNLDLGNSNHGITIDTGTLNNEIGGSAAGDANEIAYNGIGIYHAGGNGHLFRRNSIYNNDNLGIDLAPAGVTPNDNQDPDGGPNNLQNYPIVTFVRALTNSATIQGTLNSAPNQTFTIDLYGNTFADPSGSGEGRTWLGSQQVTTNGSGNATFNVALTVAIASVGQWVTATATDSSNNTSEFSVARNICASPAASPSSILAPIGGITSNFTFVNSTGCAAPTVASNRTWITGVSYGAGTVNFTVAANAGPPRDGAVVVTYNNGTGTSTLDFGISQNNGCTYGMTASQLTQSWINWTNNRINVTASDNACTWSVVNNAPSWIFVTFVDGSGNGAVAFDITTNVGAPRVGTISVGQMTFTVYQAGKTAAFDFNGDARTDVGIFRSNGAIGAEWWIANSSTGSVWAATFGSSTDKPVPADYTGDTKVDVAVWSNTTGQWNILRSENFTYYGFPFGTSGDIPVAGDFDGDFKADPAVFRPSNGTWYIQRSTGGTTIQGFGQNGDKPVVADYDRDGLADIAIYRPSNGQWWMSRSSSGVLAVTFGTATDKPVPGDYTGDLRADVAFWRPSTGEWFILRSEDFSYFSFPWGTNGDIPAPGDYDRDGRFDPAVFRPSQGNWYVSRTTDGNLIQQFGSNGDRPVANSFVP